MRELELIEAITAALEPRGPGLVRWVGDDAAVVESRPFAVTSIDAIADSVHFELGTHSPADIGHKALAVALSDLAAMGADAGQAYVSLALPSDFPSQRALELMSGLEALARQLDVAVAGGDVIASPSLVVSVTVAGWTDEMDELVYRDGAQPGDSVGVTGTLGGAGAGLLLLGGLETELDPSRRDALVQRHRRPQPLLAAGRALARAGASAMIDVSDGVATDAWHLARRSSVSIELALERLPLAVGLDDVAGAAGRNAAELAATAGDDYELLLSAPPARREAVEDAARAAGTRISWLGDVAAGAGLELVGPGGPVPVPGGHEHG